MAILAKLRDYLQLIRPDLVIQMTLSVGFWVFLYAYSLSLPAISAEVKIPIREQSLSAQDCLDTFVLSETQLSLSLNPSTGELRGDYQTILTNTSQEPLKQVCFVLNSGLKLTQMTISGVQEVLKEPAEGDAPLAYRLMPQTPFAPQSSHHLSLAYTGKVQAKSKFGHILPQDVFLTAQTFFYPRFEKALERFCPLQVKVKLPEAFVPVLSGARHVQIQSTAPTGEKTYQIGLESLCGLGNEQGFDLAAHDFQVFEAPNLKFYSARKKALNKTFFQPLTAEIQAILDVLAGQFGPHHEAPFQIVETLREDLGGMAKGNTIFLSDKYFGSPDSVAPQQYAYFKQQKGLAEIDNEFRFYRQAVLAHEGAHLFFNLYYDYDQPWFAEGLPEFASLAVLKDLNEPAVVTRKLNEYCQVWKRNTQRPLPALNQARLSEQAGYLVNYYGTPLALWKMSLSRPDFWLQWKKWLSLRDKALSYAQFSEYFKLSSAERALFELAFMPQYCQ
jgi:hypothetical protein